MGPILGPVLRALLDPKMATKIAKKPLRRGSQNGADFWTHFKRPTVQFLDRPDGMRGAPGENKRGGVEIRRVETCVLRSAIQHAVPPPRDRTVFSTLSAVAGGSQSAMRRDTRRPPFFKTNCAILSSIWSLAVYIARFRSQLRAHVFSMFHFVGAYFGGVLKFLLI